MTSSLAALSRRIHETLEDIEKVIARAQAGWKQYQNSGDDLYLDSVALSLHGFYNGIEGVLENIATSLDRQLPGGDGWHKKLLKQMASEMPEIRPAVISILTLTVLEEYLRFRHLVRNVYSFEIDPIKLGPLVEGASDAFNQVSQELTDFARWLVIY